MAAAPTSVFEPGAIPPGMPWWRRTEVAIRRALGAKLPAHEMQFGSTGPWPLNYWVGRLGLGRYVQPQNVFYPACLRHREPPARTGFGTRRAYRNPSGPPLAQRPHAEGQGTDAKPSCRQLLCEGVQTPECPLITSPLREEVDRWPQASGRVRGEAPRRLHCYDTELTETLDLSTRRRG